MEIEAKLRLAHRTEPATIEALPWQPYNLSTRTVVDQLDTFYDSADLALARTRHAVRVRARGDRLVVTFKGPGEAVDGVHRREEIELPAASAAYQDWPATIRSRVEALIGTPALQPIVTIENRRTLWLIHRQDSVIGELALDLGTIRANDRAEPMHELEVELRDGTDADLATIAAMLRAQLQATPEDRTKFARGVALLGYGT